MAIPRKLLVDPVNACAYHLVSKCVRDMFLCGWDRPSRKQYAHRRRWLVKRARDLAKAFAVDLLSHSIMSNHFHLVVYYDPLASTTWSDEEVARRWVDAFPPPAPKGARRGRFAANKVWEQRKADKRELMLLQPERLARARVVLGSLSEYMKHLKQPIARRANIEDGLKGHFFQERFYSGALLTKEAIVAAMAYVDLNPWRAKLAAKLADYDEVSIAERVRENSAEDLEAYLEPIASGLQRPRSFLEMTLGDYIGLLEGIMAADVTPQATTPAKSGDVDKWRARVRSLKKRQRAYGSEDLLRRWIEDRGLRYLETALPS